MVQAHWNAGKYNDTDNDNHELRMLQDWMKHKTGVKSPDGNCAEGEEGGMGEDEAKGQVP